LASRQASKSRYFRQVGVGTISETLDTTGLSTADFRARAQVSLAQPTVTPELSTFTLREFLILGVLKDHEMCGSEVVKLVSARLDFGIPPGSGIIYPALKTLAKTGALRSRRTHGTPRIYYSLTDQGKGRLFAIAEHWNTLNCAIQSLVEDHVPDRE
jgi:PadR family transcriptional regulator PadR